MKKLFLLVLCVIVAVEGFSQDQRANTVLEQVTRSMKSYKTIQANFIYIQENKSKNVYDENIGKVTLSGEKYKLELPSLGLEIFCNGKTIWSYVEDANEVSIMSSDDEEAGLMNPVRLFNIHQQGFKSRFVEEKNIGGVFVYIIDLFPEDESAEYKKLQIQVDKNQMIICNVRMEGNDGNDYIVKVENIKNNISVNDRIFTFNKRDYKDVEEIDLR